MKKSNGEPPDDGADDHSRTFHRAIMLNITYWQDYLDHIAPGDIRLDDRTRNGIVRAILFSLELDSQTPAWPETRELVITVTPYMERFGQWDTWNYVLKTAIQIAQNLADTSAVLTLTILLARLLRRQSRFQESVAAYQGTIRLARKIGNRYEEARSCTNLGFFFYEQGRLKRAKVLCCYALTVFEDIANAHGIAHTENHLGCIYMKEGNFDAAQPHLDRALELWQANNDNFGLMLAHMNLGQLHLYQQNPDMALTHGEKSLRLAEDSGDIQMTGTIYANIGLAYLQKQNLSKAETYSLKAEPIVLALGDLYSIANVCENLGTIYARLENWDKAIGYLTTAVERWAQIGNNIGQLQTAIPLAECYMALGHSSDAKHWLDLASDILNQQSSVVRLEALKDAIEKIRYRL